MKNSQKNRNINLLFLFSTAIMLIVTILSIRMMSNSARTIAETSAREMLAHSKAAALLVTADELDEYVLPEDMEKEGYAALNRTLIGFSETAGVEFTYFLRLNTETNMMQFIIDNTDGEFVALGLPGVAREDVPDHVLATGTAQTVPLGSYSDGWEGYLTAFAPVFYADGSPSNIIAGVDMKDIYIYQAQQNLNITAAVLAVSLVLVLGSCLLCLNLYRNKAKLAEEASRSKTAFLSNMSHEMRTPMNAIIGMAEIARGNSDPERVQYCLGRINDAADHLLGVINDVLDISKIEAGKFTLAPAEFPLENMLKRITTVTSLKIEEKKLDFSVMVDRDVPEAIISDQQRLSQVVTNLLSNAVKFTPENGRVALSIHKEEENGNELVLRFQVSDSGIGIAKERQGELFRSFVQADNSISGRYGGTGLGLAISKSIVELMGGRIWVESEPGKGSVFSFTCRVEKGTSAVGAEARGDVNLKDIKILVVDDSPDVLGYFADISQKIGAVCETTASGRQALEMLKDSSKFQLVFVDYMMPDMDGIEFTRRVREKFGNDVIITMISSAQWTEIGDNAEDAGVNHFLAKPLFYSDVVDCINKCLGKQAYEVQTAESRDIKGMFKGKRILLAEDMEVNREILAALLSDTEVELESAEDGSIAVRLFNENPDRYDLILMDIHMPELDGYQATRQIRSLPLKRSKTVPIIAMTASVFREDIEKCLASGMNDHLGKPINFDEVIEKLKKYM